MFLRLLPASLVGVAVALAAARFLAVDICLDRGGRITDIWLTCESGEGTLLAISHYFGTVPALLVCVSGSLAAYLTRRFLDHLLP